MCYLDLTLRCSDSGMFATYGIFNLETIIENTYFKLSVDCAKVVTQFYNPLNMHVLLENSYGILGLRDFIYI